VGRLIRVPGRVDADRPSDARVYDYLTGGSRHTNADPGSARPELDTMPDVTRRVPRYRVPAYTSVRHPGDARSKD
jgi:S-adenosyl methyltransferase